MNVAVIGTGNIGSRVAKRLAEHGTPVVVANSSLEHAQEAAKELSQAPALRTQWPVRTW